MYREGERPGKRETESYFNELVHAALEVGMTEIHRAGEQAGDPGRRQHCTCVLGPSGAEFLLPWGTSVLLVRSSTDGMREACHIAELICFT